MDVDPDLENVMQKLALEKIATFAVVLVISSMSIVGDALANGVDCSNFPRCTADEHIVQTQPPRATLIYLSPPKRCTSQSGTPKAASG